MAKKRVSEEMQSLDLQKHCKKLLTKGRVDRLEAKGQPKGLSDKTVSGMLRHFLDGVTVTVQFLTLSSCKLRYYVSLQKR